MDDLERLVHRAINEVLNAYVEAGWTFDGVPDVGDSLVALGAAVGRDVRQQALDLAEEIAREGGEDWPEEHDEDEPPLAYMDLAAVEATFGKASADSIRETQTKWYEERGNDPRYHGA